MKVLKKYLEILFLSLITSSVHFITPTGLATVFIELVLSIILQIFLVYIGGENIILYISLNIIILLVMLFYALKTKKDSLNLLGVYCIIFFLWGSLFCCRSI